MREIWLIGESLPLKEDGKIRHAKKANDLPENLVPLDPRHGVFPNFVMKPLFAACLSLFEKEEDKIIDFLNRIKGVLEDTAQRRFNLFENRATKSKGKNHKKGTTNPETEIFKIDPQKMEERIKAFDSKSQLWLVFGHQTNFGLLWWLLDPKKIEGSK